MYADAAVSTKTLIPSESADVFEGYHGPMIVHYVATTNYFVSRSIRLSRFSSAIFLGRSRDVMGDVQFKYLRYLGI